MSPIEFCYWLQGYFELSSDNELDKNQINVIKDHLQLVFTKVTPNSQINKIYDNMYKFPQCTTEDISKVLFCGPGNSC